MAALAPQHGAGQHGVDRVVLGQQHADARRPRPPRRARRRATRGWPGAPRRRRGPARRQHARHQRGAAQRLDQPAGVARLEEAVRPPRARRASSSTRQRRSCGPAAARRRRADRPGSRPPRGACAAAALEEIVELAPGRPRRGSGSSAASRTMYLGRGDGDHQALQRRRDASCTGARGKAGLEPARAPGPAALSTPTRPPKRLGQPLDDGQAEPRPAGLDPGRGLLELLEDARLGLGREARPGVGDGEAQGDLSPRPRPRRSAVISTARRPRSSSPRCRPG